MIVCYGPISVEPEYRAADREVKKWGQFLSQVRSAEEPSQDAPASQHLASSAIGHASLYCIISNLGDENFLNRNDCLLI
jgi:hypothetical protein